VPIVVVRERDGDKEKERGRAKQLFVVVRIAYPSKVARSPLQTQKKANCSEKFVFVVAASSSSPYSFFSLFFFTAFLGRRCHFWRACVCVGTSVPKESEMLSES